MLVYGLEELCETASKSEQNAYFSMLLSIFSVPLFFFSLLVSSDWDYLSVACFHLPHLMGIYL